MFSKTHLKGSGCSSIVGQQAVVGLAGNMIDTTVEPGCTSRTQVSCNFVSCGIWVIKNKFVMSSLQIFLISNKCDVKCY